MKGEPRNGHSESVLSILSPSERRLLLLNLKVRLRNLGAWPWLGLAAWALLARGQEPTVFRGFGVELANEAIWSGGAVVLLCALAVDIRQYHTEARFRCTAIEAAGSVLLLAFLQGLLGVAVELAFAQNARLSATLVSVSRFVLVWLPVAVLWVRPVTTRLDQCLRYACVILAVLLAAAMKRSPVWAELVGGALWWGGALFFVRARMALRTG